MSEPSTPAGADARAASMVRSSRREALRQRATVAAVIAGAVFVLVEGVSLTLWAVGTESCDADGRCVVTEWYPMHLQPRVRTETRAGRPDGIRIEYFPNGVVHFVGTYERGERVGPWREYWADGTPRFEGMLEDGELVGVERWWYPNGNLELEIERDDGERHGVETWFHESGAVRTVGRYVDGEKRGVWRVFDESGREAFTVDHGEGDPG